MGKTFNTGRLGNGLFVDASGNVGINNTSPSYRLSVNGDIASIGGTYYLQRSSASAVLPIIRYWNGTGSPMTGGTLGDILTIGTQGTNDLLFATDNSERMRITSAGNVGIGTTSPTTILTLSKPIDSSAYGSGTRMLDFMSYFTGYDVSTVKASIYAGVSSVGTLRTDNGYMAFMTANTGTLSERLRIETNGNVGINTTSPRTKLDVGGAIMTLYQASTIADKAAGIFCESTGAGLSTGFGFVIQDGFAFQGDNAASNRKLSVRKPTANGSLGDLVAYIDSAAGNSWFAGRMERPNQPAFQANRGAAGNQSLNGDSNILEFTTIVYDNSSSYNNTTFRFTAPVAGCYLFTCMARYDNTSVSNSYIRTYFTVNGASGVGANYNYGHQIMGPSGGYSTSYHSGSISAVLKLQAGDYVNVRGGVNSATTGLQFESQFSGFLI